jgi:hypothetical protein
MGKGVAIRVDLRAGERIAQRRLPLINVKLFIQTSLTNVDRIR